MHVVYVLRDRPTAAVGPFSLLHLTLSPLKRSLCFDEPVAQAGGVTGSGFRSWEILRGKQRLYITAAAVAVGKYVV